MNCTLSSLLLSSFNFIEAVVFSSFTQSLFSLLKTGSVPKLIESRVLLSFQVPLMVLLPLVATTWHRN